MQPSEFRMFSDEIARLEAEALETQQSVLNQTERLRLIEQRIAALRSVLAGSTARMNVSLDANHPLPGSPEEELLATRTAINTSLFGTHRAAVPQSVDVGSYRAVAAPSSRLRNAVRAAPVAQVASIVRRESSPPPTGIPASGTADGTPSHVDKTL